MLWKFWVHFGQNYWKLHWQNCCTLQTLNNPLNNISNAGTNQDIVSGLTYQCTQRVWWEQWTRHRTDSSATQLHWGQPQNMWDIARITKGKRSLWMLKVKGVAYFLNLYLYFCNLVMFLANHGWKLHDYSTIIIRNVKSTNSPIRQDGTRSLRRHSVYRTINLYMSKQQCHRTSLKQTS